MAEGEQKGKDRNQDIRRLREWEREFQSMEPRLRKSHAQDRLKGRGRSRRRKGGRGGRRALSMAVIILALLLMAGLLYGGFRFYQNWSGESESIAPLESSRAITPETMETR